MKQARPFLVIPQPPRIRRHGPPGWQPYGGEMWAGVDWLAGHLYVAATDPADLPADIADALDRSFGIFDD